MYRFLSSILAAFLIVLSCTAKDIVPDNVFDMTIEENIAYPPVPAKQSNAIIRHMERMKQTFKKHGFEVKSMRKGEVIDIIVPCHRLFAANSTQLLPEAPMVLNAFNAVLKSPSNYRVLVVVHSDDTGSASYLDRLTEQRATAIDEYFENALPNVNLNLVPYGVGSDDKCAENTSMAGRDANRRVEIIIIPEKPVIALAKSNRL